MKKEMLINVLQPEEIRIAILEDGVLEELYVERTSHESYVGNIYKGRIVNIEPSIQAAFVDFGVGRNGFLHVSDVEPAYYRHLEQGRDPTNRRDRGRGPQQRRRERRPYEYEEPVRPAPYDEDDAEDRLLDLPLDAEEFDADAQETFERVGGVDLDEPDAEDVSAGDEDARDQDWPAEQGEEPTREEAVGLYSEEPGAATWEPASSTSEADRDERGLDQGEQLDEVTKPEGDKLPVEEPNAQTEEAQTEETPAEDAPPEPAAQDEPRRRGKRKTTRGRDRKTKAEKEAEAKAEREAEEAPADDRPRPMESAERRTEEGDAPDDLFSDEDLSFSMAPPAKPSQAARDEETREEDDLAQPREAEAPQAERQTFSRDQDLDEVSEDDFAPPPQAERQPREEDRGHRSERGDPRGRGGRDRGDRGGRERGGRERGGERGGRERGGRDRGERGGRDRGDRGGRDRGDRERGGRGDRGERRGRDDRRGGGRPMRGRDQGRAFIGRPKPLIQDIFKRGQEVLVQVIKEGIGTKGPTLSTYISIAGRYLVLMPGLNRIGVSRKIADEEARRRLRENMRELQPPPGLGFIIRTAGQDRNKKELQRDLIYLSRLWRVVVRRIKKQKSPCEIYQESDMITRTIRDIFTNDIQTIYVDEPSAFEHAKEFLEIVMPRFSERIRLWDSAEPMFHKYGIENEINRIQQRHVPLPNGGSIVIDQTEALVAIDVNSGNFRADNNAEETAYQMNLLAAKEIARQLRLRDLGGVIVNDFIDMREERHRRNVERALREAVRRDRARTKILKISQFGMIEMTRQRIRPSLKRSVFTECPHCKGTSQVKTCESMSIEVMRLLQLASHRENYGRIEVRVEEEVAHYLLNRKRGEVAKLEETGGKQIFIRATRGVAPEHMEFFCQDLNGNEVKFNPYEEQRPLRRVR